MAEKQEIEVTIGVDGKVTAKAKGIKGAVCLKEMGGLFAKLGAMTDIDKTQEFYEQRVELNATRDKQR